MAWKYHHESLGGNLTTAINWINHHHYDWDVVAIEWDGHAHTTVVWREMIPSWQSMPRASDAPDIAPGEPPSPALCAYLRREATIADASSRQWTDAGGTEQAAFRAGMWAAYHNVEKFVGAPVTTSTPPPAAARLMEGTNPNRFDHGLRG